MSVRGGNIFEEELKDLIETDEKVKKSMLKLSDQSDYAKEDESDSEQSHNFQDKNVDFKKFGNTVQVKASHNQFGNI